MGGGQSGGGSSSQTSYNVPVIPPELKPLYAQTAQNVIGIQNQLPLGGSTQYTQQMLNPAYTQWQSQYGGYNMPGGGYYNQPGTQAGTNLFRFPQQFQQPQVGGEGQMYIPPAPPQYVNNPASAVQQTPNFLAPQVQQKVPISQLEQQAANLTPSLLNRPEAEQMALQYAQTAGQAPSSAQYWQPGAFEASPYYSTARGAFNTGVLPTIQNQMALSGLGRSSSAANAMAQGWAGMLPGVLSQYATQYVEPQMAREQEALNRQAGLVSTLGQIGTQDTARTQAAINAMMAGGERERSLQQAVYDAQYADMLRRQALAEEALYTPMGMIFPSSIGSSGFSSGGSSQKSSGGGLFK